MARRRLTISAALIAALALTPALASAGQGGARADRRQEMLDEYDTDDDGRLSEDERAAARNARADDIFGRYDADGDGKWSREEWETARGEMRSRRGRAGRGSGARRGGF